MNWILGIIFVLILGLLINNSSRKKKLKKIKKTLLENWGKPKKEKYFNFYVIGKYFENNSHKKNNAGYDGHWRYIGYKICNEIP